MTVNGLIVLIDLSAMVAAVAASWLWYLASRRGVRRVSKFEELDARDTNRIVTAINRAQILNSRAALAASFVSLLAGCRFALDLVAR